MERKENNVLLIAEDDPDDQLLCQEALKELNLEKYLVFVQDGVELLDYLHRRAQYVDPERSPRPWLIVLDLKMPRKNGWEALGEIKADRKLRNIPIVILTTSNNEDDVQRSRDLGANAYYIKPVSFEGLVSVMKRLANYMPGVSLSQVY